MIKQCTTVTTCNCDCICYCAEETYTPLVEYYVSKKGDDDLNDGLSPERPFRTIKKAVSVATEAGTTIYIMRGVWKEVSGVNFYGVDCAIGPLYDGKKDLPITFKAFPGDENLVIFDGEYRRCAAVTGNHDYIEFENIIAVRNRLAAIATGAGNRPIYWEDVTKINRGLAVRGCYLYDTVGSKGENIASIRADMTRDLTVTDTTFDRVTQDNKPGTHTQGIIAYSTANAKISNCYFKTMPTGIHWKDHFLHQEDNRHIELESEISMNRFNTYSHAVKLSTGTKTPYGNNHIHHNIGDGITVGIYAVSANAPDIYPGGYILSEFNAWNLNKGNLSSGINVDVGDYVHNYGNITTNYAKGAIMTHQTHKKPTVKITKSDYNIYDSQNFVMRLGNNDAYPLVPLNETNLNRWKTLTTKSHIHLGVNYPDMHSIQAKLAEIYNDPLNGDFTYTEESPAIGFMPDGTNAGPYQNKNNVIGPHPGKVVNINEALKLIAIA